MKKVGLIDVDGHNFPNLPLMKLSAWHKRKGDEVEWYEPFKGILEEYDIVYMSKVFSDEYTKDYEFPVYAKKVVKGGTGYAIKKETGIGWCNNFIFWKTPTFEEYIHGKC